MADISSYRIECIISNKQTFQTHLLAFIHATMSNKVPITESQVQKMSLHGKTSQNETHSRYAQRDKKAP